MVMFGGGGRGGRGDMWANERTGKKTHWEGTNTQTDIATYRLNWPRGRFSENSSELCKLDRKIFFFFIIGHNQMEGRVVELFSSREVA